MPELIETEVLIIGCGVAGGTVALRLADAGMPVTVVTRAAEPNDTNTHWAQGGKHGVLRRCPHPDEFFLDHPAGKGVDLGKRLVQQQHLRLHSENAG